jgi:hypothetical protein
LKENNAMQNNSNLIRKLIAQVFDSQMDAARKLKVNPKTVRNWCRLGGASHVVAALDGLCYGAITNEGARRILKEKRSRRVIPPGTVSKTSYTDLIAKGF